MLAGKVAERLAQTGGNVAALRSGDHDSALLNERQAAKRLGVSVQLLRKWRANEQGPRFSKFGKCIRYSVEEIERFIRLRQQKAGEKCAASVR